MTLNEYLAARGKSKALTRIEAEAFGVPYPLIGGWPIKFGVVEITPGMIACLRAKISGAKESTAGKARAALDTVFGDGAQAVRKSTPQAAPKPVRTTPAAFHGFRLRGGPRSSPAATGLPWD